MLKNSYRKCARETIHRPLSKGWFILEGVVNWIALSNSTAGKGASMQVIKQPEHGRTSANEEQIRSSLQTKTMINSF